MHSNRTDSYVKSILKYCQDILDIQAASGATYEAFLQNKGYQYSVSFCVEQIGEMAKKLRDVGFADKYPNVQWNEIAGLRNRIAHGYDSIDLEMVYDISVEDIPKLFRDCQEILMQETRDIDEKIALANSLQREKKAEGQVIDQKDHSAGR